MTIESDNIDCVMIAQTRLKDLRLYAGPINGRGGPATQAALQSALAPMLANGRGTGAGAASQALDNTDFVIQAQVQLRDIGLYSGPINGHGDEATQASLRQALSSAEQSEAEAPPSGLTAPSITTAASASEVDGGATITYTFTPPVVAGNPTPTVTRVLTLGGLDVTGAMSGNAYVATKTGATQALVMTYTASNGVSPNATSTVSRTVPVAPVVVPFTAVAADGWRATATNPVAAAATTLAVTRPGFDASGNAATVTDLVPVNGRLRQAFPNQSTLTADTVVMQRFVYSGDTLPAGVANGSSRAYPGPQTCWLEHDYFAIPMTGTFSVNLVVAHPFARNGRPVAAVRIIASDGTTTREQVVSTLTFQSWPASGLGVDSYRATFTATDFIEGAEVTVDAIIYPWCGPSYRLSVNGNAAPNMKNTVIRGYRVTPVYAYVSPSGNDGTGQASTNPATAAALPFLTVNGALTTATRGITAVTGRSEAGGGVVRFPVGTWDWVKTSLSGVTVTTACVCFESINPANRDTTIIANTTGTTGHSLPNRAIVRNVTLRKVGDAVALMRGNGISSGAVVFDNCVLDRNAQTQRAYWINFLGRSWFINCTDNLASSTASAQANATDAKNCVLIGSVMTGNCVISQIASRSASVSVDTRAAVTLGMAQGMIVNSVISGNAASGFQATFTGAFLATPGLGYAVVGNVFETFGGSGGTITAWADGNTQEVHDFLFEANTLPGASDATRFNRLYSDDPGATLPKDMTMRFNVMGRSASKTEVFAATTAAVGNWPVAFGVGHAYNTFVEGRPGTDSYTGPGSWRYELEYLGIQIGDGAGGVLNPLWTLDASITGTGLGGGDYRPLAGSPLIRIPAGMAHTARDMLGQAIANNGTAFVGALQAA